MTIAFVLGVKAASSACSSQTKSAEVSWSAFWLLDEGLNVTNLQFPSAIVAIGA